MDIIKRMYKDLLGPASHLQLANKELENARRALLTNLTSKEYFVAQVAFETKRIQRLEKYIAKHNEK